MGNKSSRNLPAGAAAAAQGGGGAAAAPGEAAAGAAGGEGGAVEIPSGLKDAKVSIADFELLKLVGRGSFGKVFLAKKRTGADKGCVYAIKTLRKDVLLKRGQLEHTRTERLILQAVHHPYIVSLKCAFQNPEKLYLVTDFCSGGELFFWLKR
jgi:serine/threonine protein kinase